MGHAHRAGRVALFVLAAAVATAIAVAIAPSRETVDPEIAIDEAPATTAPTTTTPPVPMAVAAGASAPVISRVDTTDPVVFLTIDDGLAQEPAVLEYLRRHRTPFTMFPTPPYVAQNPAFFAALHELGASVQDHTVNHKDLTMLSAGEQQREICDVLPDYEARFGQRPWLLRPPGGFSNSAVQIAARSCGVRAVVLWQAAVNDGHLDVQGGGPLQRGDIVLLHFRHDLRHNLEVVTAAAAAAGLRPARLEDYLTPS